MSFQRNILITGASSGIGEICALHLARLGFRVFAGVRKQSAAESLIHRNTGNIIPVFIDITNQGMIDAAFELIAAKTGNEGLCALINNAGIGFGAPIECIPFSQLKKVFAVDVFGHIAVIQKFLPLIRKGWGRIINMSSISGQLSQPFQSAYSAAKNALESFSDSLRIELRPWDIPVVVIEPGSIDTKIWRKNSEITKKLFAHYPPEEQELYQSSITAYLNTADKFSHHPLSAYAVAKTVAHVLAAKHPKTRYIIGGDALLMYYLIKPLPDLIRDVVLASIMGLPKKGSRVT